MLFTLLFGICCATFVCVHGWGSVGHGIIARLAQSQLTGSAPEWIRDLVPWHHNGNLTAIASWADHILYEYSNPTGSQNWQWSRPLHFLNTPDWNCTYQVGRDCLNDVCIDGAIRNYTKRLESELDIIQWQEALYFLVHYVGDIHQPLHTGFLSDYGGNKIKGRFMNKSAQNDLHSLWDSEVINYRIQRDFFADSSIYYEYIYQLMIRTSKTDNDDDIQQWIKENMNLLCQQIYLDDNNKTMNASMKYDLGENYYRRVFPIIDQRLALGGRRLGALLNRLGQNRHRVSTKSKQYMTVYIPIAVLCGALIIGAAVGIYLCIRCRIKHRR